MTITVQSTKPRRLVGSVVAATLAAALLVGCGGGGSPHAADVGGSDSTSRGAETVESTTSEPTLTAEIEAAPIHDEASEVDVVDSRLDNPDLTIPDDAADEVEAARPVALRAVSIVEHLEVLDQPDGVPVTVLGPYTDFGTPTVLGVVATIPDVADTVGAEPGVVAPGAQWVEVLVPERPNDLRGWVRGDHVRVETLATEVHVDLAGRTLRLYEQGELADEWTVAIGRPDRPTPTGTYFITDKLATDDPGGVYGPYALGVSAFSDVLFDFIGGVGQVGIHGTNDPSSIGNAASSGCIRLPNHVIEELVDRLPVGTPVHIW